jgi:hypothetical protein
MEAFELHLSNVNSLFKSGSDCHCCDAR